ncbi:MAG: TonB-dependent receptor [Acidobacteria bacterium]|nr:TonB-dependent receptor [Acidobacteriota bacterium]
MFRLVLRLTLLAALALPRLVFGQFDAAAVLGTVRDPSGAVVPNSKVTLENTKTGILETKQTDSAGNFEFLTVRIGSYRAKAEAAGFKTAVAGEFTVVVGARQRVDLRLEVGETSQTIEIRDAAAALETDSSDRGQIIGRDNIVNLPLNGRAYADLALLAPGVRKSAISDRESSFNVNGLRSSLNNFQVDGVDNNAYGTSNQGYSNQVVQLNPDAVAEFKVQTNNYSAEYGRAGGAIVNVSVRSGTNEFHGAVWEFLRNTKLNAVGFFKPSLGKPVLQQNQFGAALGGPIRKNKTFFFADFEGLKRVQRQLSFSTIPTLDQRQGIFTMPIRNPYTNAVYSNGVVPKSEITTFASKVFGVLPAPTRSGISNNYDSMPRVPTVDNKGDGRLDHYFGSKLTAFFRYSHREYNQTDNPIIPLPLGADNSQGNVNIVNKQGAGGVTYTLSPTSLVEFRMGITQTIGGKWPLQIGMPNMQEEYGIPGLPTDPAIAGGLSTQSIGGYQGLGRRGSTPQFQNPVVINPKVNYSKIVSRHTMKTGWEFQRIHTEILDFSPQYGNDSYSGQFSRPTGAGQNNIFNVADFLYGARSRYGLANWTVVNYRQRMNFFYFQDDFKLSPKLTLNLGLRYEYATPQWEADNRLSNYDPAAVKTFPAKSGSIYDRALVKPDCNNWSPRIGFAYSLLKNTVVRGGYGISYIHFNRMGGENILSYNGPHVIDIAIDQLPDKPLCAAGEGSPNCFRPTMMGYPAGMVAPEKFSTLNARTNYTPADNRTAYVQSWHFTIQCELARDLVLDVAYVGNRGVKLMILGDYNQARPNNPGENLVLQARRPIQTFQYIQISWGGGFSNYHALQTKLEKKFSRGLYLLNSFTFSKSIDNAAGHLETANGDNSRVNYRDLRNEKGVGSYNQPLNNTSTLVYDLPYGKGRRFGSSAHSLVQGVVGNWRLTAINTMTSGMPVNLSYGPTAQFSVSGAPTYRPNITGGAMAPVAQRNIDNYFNKDNVQLPVNPLFPFGNAGRNIARGYAFYQADMGLHKDFPVWREGRRIEFRSEFFNLFNRTNFASPNSSRSSSGFGTIRGTSPARMIQFALKFVF